MPLDARSIAGVIVLWPGAHAKAGCEPAQGGACETEFAAPLDLDPAPEVGAMRQELRSRVCRSHDRAAVVTRR